MKNRFIKILALALPVLILFACKDSFLDAPVQGAISGDVLSTSEAGVDASLIATYKMLSGFTNTVGNTWGAAPSNYMFNSASDDVHKGSEPSDNPDGYYEISIYQWQTGLGILRHKFSAVYEGVKRANNAINIAKAYQANGGSADFVSRITGEALFLRAWYHFEAYKMWKNVPYYYETDVSFTKPNDTPVLPLIAEDLNKAIDLLPEVRSSVGRADQAVAKALLGKVLLFSQDFSGAKTQFDAVVATNRFRLNDCYNDNFTVAGQNSSESIFALQTSINDGDGNGSNSNFLERLAAPHSGSSTDCCGFNNPTQDLANAFKVDANGLPVANPNSSNITVGTGTPVDPRIDWTMGRTGVPYLDWGLHSDGWIRGAGWAGWYSPKKNMKLTVDDGAGGWNVNQLNAKNVEFLRYSDLLLMLAECEVEANTPTSLERARALVNMVRTRAGNCAQGPVGGPLAVPINDAAITWATYDVKPYTANWTDQAAARSAVRLERRLELATEGHRIFDLRRWGVLENVMNTFFAFEKTVTSNGVRIGACDAAGTVEPRHYAFPIPSTEIDLSDGNLKQNTGF